MNKGGNSMKNYQTLIGFALVAIAIIIAAVIISGALNDFASSIVSGLCAVIGMIPTQTAQIQIATNLPILFK